MTNYYKNGKSLKRRTGMNGQRVLELSELF